jgi:acetyltransferase-like isoleucine patch superfamily enzyme
MIATFPTGIPRRHLRIRRALLSRHTPRALRRVASWLASAGVPPHHDAAFLSSLSRQGFVSPRASVHHSCFETGAHVLIGDGVVVRETGAGGRIRIADRAHLYGNSFLETGSGGSIEIGEEAHIQPGCHLHSQLSRIRIGRRAEIAANCAFYNYNHGCAPHRLIVSQPLESRGDVVVGDDAWLGHGVIVLHGVTIGEGAVIGAGSVVTSDIPPMSVAAGVPARVLRGRHEMVGGAAGRRVPACAAAQGGAS